MEREREREIMALRLSSARICREISHIIIVHERARSLGTYTSSMAPYLSLFHDTEESAPDGVRVI